MSEQNNMNTPPINQGANPAPARKLKLGGKKNQQQSQNVQQQNVNMQTEQNVPVFTQQMLAQLKQLLQLQQTGQIQPQQAQYLQQLQVKYQEYQRYLQQTQGMGTPIIDQSNVNNMQNANMQGANMQMQNNIPKKKKKSKLPFIIIGVVILLILVVASRKKNNTSNETNAYENTGRYAIDKVINNLKTYDPEQLDASIGTEDGDSYLAQEYAYVNNVKLRQEFIEKVASVVDVEYPVIEETNKKGEVINTYTSDMLNGETVKVTIPDYNALLANMDGDADTISNLYKSSHIATTDYTYQDEWFDLFCQYYVDYANVPTKQVEMKFNIRQGLDGQYYIADDIDLDQLLYSSDEFHDVLDKFSQISIDYTGLKEETYTVEEYTHNPEYDAWFKLFLKYFEADGGEYDAATGTFKNVQKAFDKHSSKWEPWYLRDDNNVIQKDENGNYIVNYFSVKADDGTDWIQPAEEMLVEVEKTRDVDDPWFDERGIWYNNCGTYYLQNLYNGLGLTIFRVGDGSVENPAGVGTPIITKVQDINGEYHDVEVTLLAYWTGQDAIDYVQKFDSRNRGFTNSSVVQLIAYEIKVRNLDGDSYVFNSEMSLCDAHSNTASRTGTMYSFSKDISLEAGESVIINDWANSTEIEQKYVVWGKSFSDSYSRDYKYVYFRVLAGEGNVPTYSAYDYFVTNQAHVSSEEVETTTDSITN